MSKSEDGTCLATGWVEGKELPRTPPSSSKNSSPCGRESPTGNQPLESGDMPEKQASYHPHPGFSSSIEEVSTDIIKHLEAPIDSDFGSQSKAENADFGTLRPDRLSPNLQVPELRHGESMTPVNRRPSQSSNTEVNSDFNINTLGIPTQAAIPSLAPTLPAGTYSPVSTHPIHVQVTPETPRESETGKTISPSKSFEEIKERIRFPAVMDGGNMGEPFGRESGEKGIEDGRCETTQEQYFTTIPTMSPTLGIKEITGADIWTGNNKPKDGIVQETGDRRVETAFVRNSKTEADWVQEFESPNYPFFTTEPQRNGQALADSMFPRTELLPADMVRPEFLSMLLLEVRRRLIDERREESLEYVQTVLAPGRAKMMPEDVARFKIYASENEGNECVVLGNRAIDALENGQLDLVAEIITRDTLASKLKPKLKLSQMVNNALFHETNRLRQELVAAAFERDWLANRKLELTEILERTEVDKWAALAKNRSLEARLKEMTEAFNEEDEERWKDEEQWEDEERYEEWLDEEQLDGEEEGMYGGTETRRGSGEGEEVFVDTLQGFFDFGTSDQEDHDRAAQVKHPDKVEMGRNSDETITSEERKRGPVLSGQQRMRTNIEKMVRQVAQKTGQGDLPKLKDQPLESNSGLRGRATAGSVDLAILRCEIALQTMAYERALNGCKERDARVAIKAAEEAIEMSRGLHKEEWASCMARSRFWAGVANFYGNRIEEAQANLRWFLGRDRCVNVLDPEREGKWLQDWIDLDMTSPPKNPTGYRKGIGGP